MMQPKFLILAIALSLSACAGGEKPPLGGAANLQVLDMTELPPPVDAGEGDVEYRIGAYDRLTIDVFGVEDLGREVQVDGAGRIALPLAGTIQAGGSTPFELAQRISARLQERYVRDPQVSVNLKEAISQVVTVDGEVREPGLYPVVGNMTLMRAVARSSGLTEFAKLDDVVVFRTVGENRYVALFNLGAIRRGNYADPKIYAGDVIIVGDSPGRRMLRDIVGISTLISTPLVALANQL